MLDEIDRVLTENLTLTRDARSMLLLDRALPLHPDDRDDWDDWAFEDGPNGRQRFYDEWWDDHGHADPLDYDRMNWMPFTIGPSTQAQVEVVVEVNQADERPSQRLCQLYTQFGPELWEWYGFPAPLHGPAQSEVPRDDGFAWMGFATTTIEGNPAVIYERRPTGYVQPNQSRSARWRAIYSTMSETQSDTLFSPAN